MYRPKAYAVDDAAELHAFIRKHPFALIAAHLEGKVHFAHVPVVLDSGEGRCGGVRFHLARANPLCAIDGASVRFAFRGPDAYVSPDWYEAKGLVPTWNYMAIEASGMARALGEDELRQLLIDLSAQQEEKLRPKPPWTIDKVPPEKLAALMAAIRGFSVYFESLEGKFKLSQDKSAGDISGAVNGLKRSGDIAIADAMLGSLVRRRRPASV